MCPRGSIVFVCVDVLFVATATPYIGCFAIIAIIKIPTDFQYYFCKSNYYFLLNIDAKRRAEAANDKAKIQISSIFEILKLLCDTSTTRTFGGTPLSGLLDGSFLL